MAVNNNWRQPQNMSDWMRDIEKRLMHEERRPIPPSPTSVVGPGFRAYANVVVDWDSDGPIVGGHFHSVAGQVVNSPDDDKNWIGIVQSNSIGQGLQRVWEYIESPTSPSPDPAAYVRAFVTNPDGTRNYSPWLQGGGGGSGSGTIIVQDEGVTVVPETTQLDFIGAGVSVAAGTGEAQITVDGTPHGTAGGSLSGTYPSPSLATNSVGHDQIIDGSIQASDLAAGVIPVPVMLNFPSQTTWVGVHNLNQRPVDVTLMSSTNEEFVGTITYPDVNTVQASFGVAVAGYMLVQK